MNTAGMRIAEFRRGRGSEEMVGVCVCVTDCISGKVM